MPITRVTIDRQAVKDQRLGRRMTQQELGLLIGRSRQVVHGVETSGMATLAYLDELATVYGRRTVAGLIIDDRERSWFLAHKPSKTT